MGRPKGAKDKKPRKKCINKLRGISPTVAADREREKAALEEYIEVLEAKHEELKASDPFWFFEPSTGEIPEKRLEFIKKYLKPEDIPQRLDGQIDIFLSEASIVGGSGGNQSGKSTAGAISGYIKSTGEIPRAFEKYKDHPAIAVDIERAKRKFIRGRVVGVDFKQLSNTVLPAWKQWVPREYLKNGRWTDSFSSQHNTLTLYRKREPCATIEFMTNQQDVESFQGPPLDWLKYDEEPRQDIHKENLMRFTTAERLDIGFYWTPTKGLSWATDLFLEDEDKHGRKIELFKLCSVTNKCANIEVLSEILNEVESYDELKMRLLGEAISLSGLVYGRLFDRQIHVIDPFYEKLTYDEQRNYLCLSGWDPHTNTPAAGVFILFDREGNAYVDFCYFKSVDTEDLKRDFTEIVKERNYRMGWSVADKSSDSTNVMFSGRNIFKEISRGKNCIPSLRTSIKFEGSIRSGVDEIKKRLKLQEGTKKPRLCIVKRPENKVLINSFRTLERDTYANEDVKGPKDRIREGRHHLHAALRYVFQFPVNWYAEVYSAPEPQYFDEAACH